MKPSPFFCLMAFALFSLVRSVAAQTDGDAPAKRADGSRTEEAPLSGYDNMTLWKNWAFASCISEAFHQHEVVCEDARRAAGAYFEFGSGLDVYSQLAALAQDYLKGHPYRTLETGEEIKLMKCIDFYLSGELHDFLDHYQELSAQVRLMWDAIQDGDMPLLRKLFADRDLADPQFVPMTVDLLVGAVDADHFEAIRTLIELGVDPDIDNRASESALEQALSMEKGDARYLNAMLDGGLSPDYKRPDGDPLLHHAVSSAPESTKEVVDRATKSREKTASDQQAAQGETDPLGFVRLLIERGADINAKNAAGKTALDHAARQYKTDIALYLAGRGAKFSDHTAKIIYDALYRLEASTPLFYDFIALRDQMKAQGIDWLPPMPDPDAR